MTAIKVTITRFVREDQPGWVAFEFVDAHGSPRQFVEKAPIVSIEELTKTSQYPRQGFLDVEVLGRKTKESQEVVIVDTSKPWGVESVDGVTQFEVSQDSLVML